MIVFSKENTAIITSANISLIMVMTLEATRILTIIVLLTLAAIGGAFSVVVLLQQQQASAFQYYTCNTNGDNTTSDTTCKHQGSNYSKDKTLLILPFP